MKVSVLGAGAWGTAIACHAARRHPVHLWARDPAQAQVMGRRRENPRYLPGVRFPDGLRDCITRMKEDFDIMVGMWHPTTGYWRGIDPEGKIAKEYGDLLFKHPDGWLLPDLGSLEKSYLFYNAFHSFLRSCGADFVKVDNQSFIRNYYKNILPVGEAARTLHRHGVNHGQGGAG